MGLPTEACQMVNGLTRKQKAVCAESPALIPVILQVLDRVLSRPHSSPAVAVADLQKLFFDPVNKLIIH